LNREWVTTELETMKGFVAVRGMQV